MAWLTALISCNGATTVTGASDSSPSANARRPSEWTPSSFVTRILLLELDGTGKTPRGKDGARKELVKLWSARADLNRGPLAPQTKNINHLLASTNDNTRLSGWSAPQK